VTVVVLAWNAHANATTQAGRVTRALTEWNGADIQAIVLTEVKGCRAALKAWGKGHGYRLFQERPILGRRDDERGDTAILLRVKGTHAVKPRRRWVAVMDKPWWVFRYRVLHQPRRHLRVAFDLPGSARVRLSGEHWPTRGNRAAWEESYASARRFLERKKPALVVGDLNASRNDVHGLADDVGGKYAGRGVDWLVTNRRARINVTELIGGGSDHKALLFEVED
jgi:endonuclease/exonuclease/phosphatase (EEP) superfamily protein YafD